MSFGRYDPWIQQSYRMHQVFKIFKWKFFERNDKIISFKISHIPDWEPYKSWNSYKLHPILPMLEYYDSDSKRFNGFSHLQNKPTYKNLAESVKCVNSWPLNYFSIENGKKEYAELVVCKSNNKENSIDIYHRTVNLNNMEIVINKLCSFVLKESDCKILTTFVIVNSLNEDEKQLEWKVLYENY